MKSTQAMFRAAVIGVGRKDNSGGQKGGGHQIGYTHARTLKNDRRVHLMAAADIHAENLAAFQAEFGVGQGFADYREMLREARPEIVTIGTYVGLHEEMITECARAGVRGVLCEKPFLHSPAALRRVAAVARETQIKIVVAHIRRYLPAFRKARELFNDRSVGYPLVCLAGLQGWDLSEWGSHWLDMFRFFNCDQPVRYVMGQGKVGAFRGYGHAMEEQAVAYFEFENGCRGILDGGRGLFSPGANVPTQYFGNVFPTMTLVGSSGTVRIFGEGVVKLQNAGGEQVFQLTPDDWWAATWPPLLNDLIAWVIGSPEPELGLANMLKTAELNLAAYVSMIRGTRVDLPLEDDLDEWPVEVLARRAAGQGADS